MASVVAVAHDPLVLFFLCHSCVVLLLCRDLARVDGVDCSIGEREVFRDAGVVQSEEGDVMCDAASFNSLECNSLCGEEPSETGL